VTRIRFRRPRRTGQHRPVAPPDPAQVEALTWVFEEVSRRSGYGGTFGELASAALTWMDQQQRGEGRDA
jgi:hypothetical protein